MMEATAESFLSRAFWWLLGALGHVVRIALAVYVSQLAFIGVSVSLMLLAGWLGSTAIALIGIWFGSAVSMVLGIAICKKSWKAIPVLAIVGFPLIWLSLEPYPPTRDSAVWDVVRGVVVVVGYILGAWWFLRDHREGIKRLGFFVLLIAAACSFHVLHSRSPGFARVRLVDGLGFDRVSFSVADSEIQYVWTSDNPVECEQDVIVIRFGRDYPGAMPSRTTQQDYRLRRLRNPREVDAALEALWLAEERLYEREFGPAGLPFYLRPLHWLRGDGRHGTVWRVEIDGPLPR